MTGLRGYKKGGYRPVHFPLEVNKYASEHAIYKQ